MNTIIILGFLGLFLIYLEFFLPGVIVGCLGGMLLLISYIIFFLKTPALWQIIVFVLTSAVLLFLTIQLAIWRLRQSGKKGTMYLQKDQEGYKASFFKKEMIGKKGRVLTDLRPSGYIVIDEKSYQAISRDGYIEKEAEIEVIGGRGGYFVVRISNAIEQ